MKTLDQTFHALSDPTRRAILARLAEGECRVGDLAAPFSISAPAISRHLRVLEGAALIRREKHGVSHVMRLNPDALREASAWIDHHRAFWTSSFDRLADHLETTGETPT